RGSGSALGATVGLDLRADEPAGADVRDPHHRRDACDSTLPARIVLAEDQIEVDQVSYLGFLGGREEPTGLAHVPCHAGPALELHGKIDAVPPSAPAFVRRPPGAQLLFEFGHGSRLPPMA